MTVVIRPLVGTTLSSLISLSYGPILNLKESDIMDYCQRMGEVWTGFVDGELVCCWGMIPPSFLSMEAYLWMWWCGEKVQHQFLFIRHSQRQVEDMLKKYEVINGHCQAKPQVVRWLKWLGAEFSEGDHGKLTFSIRRRGHG